MTLQQLKHFRRIGWIWLGALVVLLTVMWLLNSTMTARADDASGSVFYQVTYADRSIKDIPQPPTTNQGIIMVVKIARYDSGSPSYTTVSTGNTPVEVLNPGKTVQTPLKWDGKQWVSALESTPKAANANGSSAATAKQGDPLTDIAGRIQAVQAAVKKAQAALDAGNTQAAQDALKQAQAANDQGLAMIAHVQKMLVARGNMQKNPDPKGPPPVLKTQVNISGYGAWGGWPGWGAWPPVGNASVYTEQPNPDYDVGPRVEIRKSE